MAKPKPSPIVQTDTEKPFIRSIGRFRKSKSGNGLNLKVQGKYYVIPITELNGVLNGELETGEIREYCKKEIDCGEKETPCEVRGNKGNCVSLFNLTVILLPV